MSSCVSILAAGKPVCTLSLKQFLQTIIDYHVDQHYLPIRNDLEQTEVSEILSMHLNNLDRPNGLQGALPKIHVLKPNSIVMVFGNEAFGR